MEKIKSKGWVGNICHKFEAVCQEVDEFVTKDTVKYVENQVQTVGANWKKLYSDVVQDFLVPIGHTKKEARAVYAKPKKAVGTYIGPVTGTTWNPIKEQADNPLESHNASNSTELVGLVASEEAEIGFTVGNECASATCKNSHEVFKENITGEEAQVDEESSTFENKISSESCSDKDSKDTMCYSFSDDDKCFCDASSSQIILQEENIVKEEQPLADGSSSFLDNFSKSQLRASKNDQMFDSSLDDINCISNVPISQMDLQQNITSEVQPVTDQSNSLGYMTLLKSVEESHGISITTKFPPPALLYDKGLHSFPDNERECNVAESIANVTIIQMNLQDNISEDQLASKESSSAKDKSLLQTPAFASDIPPTSLNNAGLSMDSSLDDLACVSDKSSMSWAFEDAPSTFQSSELVLSRVNESTDVDTGVSNSSLLAESSSLSTSSIGNFTLEAEFEFSISTGLSSSLSTSLASANNVVSVISALSSAPSLTDFIGCMNDSSIDLPGMETIDLSDKGKLKESCVLVDSKLHNRISFRPRKYKSYKELIREAFASRKRLIKEYKQLAVLYADVDTQTSQHAEVSRLPSLPSPCIHATESSTCNLCESEWELL